jgi:multidrug efflux pump subunit AcrB
MSRFFIDRPIFASVLSIVIFLGGGIALVSGVLPVAQYPDITPPTVEVSAFYPGANAQVVADTVAAPIEQQVNGVENMLYMSSQCTNDGTYTLTVTFKNGVDLNMAQVLVQNRESLAEPILPDLVKRRGVTVKKKSPTILTIVNLYSPGGTRDNLYLSNYATIQLRDELARLKGVGDITYLGQRDYSMRIWLDPGKMSFRNLTATDVSTAISQQNIQVAAGQIGQPPIPTGQVFQYTMTTLGRLEDPEQFANIILKTDTDGRIVRLRDVARIELGAQGYDQTCTLDGQPSVALSIYQRPGSNALETADLVKAKMEELKKRFPEGLDYSIVYDTTPFITESVREVFNTLRDAVILVSVVVLLFLQNWRSALIPLIAVPVAIVGTAAVMAAMGFSLNNLTLFGLVLAIGIVVDDAIVVVEAVEHHVEHGMAPRDATIRAMDEVSGPVIAIGLVLTAVFVPCAFISGIVGQFFRQFALTIAVSTLISAFNSLTLSPALAAILIKPKSREKPEALPRLAYVLAGGAVAYILLTPYIQPYLASFVDATPARVSRMVASVAQWWPWASDRLGSLPGRVTFLVGLTPALLAVVAGGLVGWVVGWPLDRILVWFFGVFNAAFTSMTRGYTWIVGVMLKGSLAVVLIYGGLLYLTYYAFDKTPTGFIPEQDKGYVLVNVQMPDSTSVEKTQAVMRRVEEIALKTPGVKHTVAIAGQSILLNANAPNFGAMYVMLEDFHERTNPKLHTKGYDLRLMSSGDMPTTGEKLVVLDEEGEVLRFRIFDDEGKMVVDTDTQSLMEPAGLTDGLMMQVGSRLPRGLGNWTTSGRIKDLTAKLSRFRPPHELTEDEKSLLLANVRSIVQHTLRHQLDGVAILKKLQAELQHEIIEALVNVFGAPPVEGLGTAGGFKIVIEDRGDMGFKALQENAERVVSVGTHLKYDAATGAVLMEDAERVAPEGTYTQGLQGLFTSFRANTPWLYLNIDRDKVNAMGVSMDEVFNTLQVYLGSLYVNDFNRFGRTWQVNVQGDANFRKQIEDLKLLKIRNQYGGMAPFGAMASVEPIPGPVLIMRYNMYPAAAINGAPGPGISSGQAIDMMTNVGVADDPDTMRREWTELALLQLQTGNTAMIVFALAVVLVFLVLAAQYESWSLPFSVILVVPMCLLCSVVGVQMAKMDINIFTQIGFIVLVGLACKNAILIVEFAKARREEGVPRYQATLDACNLRLRPIMMTSFAFILGVVPLVWSEGAGSEMRQALGTAVFGGMLGVTLFGIFLTPVFYFVIQWINDLMSGDHGTHHVPPLGGGHHPSTEEDHVEAVEEPSDEHVLTSTANGTGNGTSVTVEPTFSHN